MKKISAYWKCQIIGWLLFGAICILAIMINEPNPFNLVTLILLMKILGGGLIISHLLKLTIKKLRILEKHFAIQVLSLLGLTILYTFVWLFLLDLSVEVSFMTHSGWIWTMFLQGVFLGGGLLIWNLVYFMYHYVRKAKNEERQKLQKERELLELEAKALRARMNPHFIFNCLNSIKSLIQSNDSEKAIDYLTTFSKLIRTLFYNSDKRRISLFDEIENCRLYIELEAMRLSGKLTYQFEIEPGIDLKSVMVPALIIQPFIENAIWHGIVPKGEGVVTLRIYEKHGSVICEIEDNGIGRELSITNRPKMPAIYQSKGIDLSNRRLQLEKVLNESNASIETIDKYDNESPSGTKVKVSFNLN